jgi:putative Mn2+ efflux pump MntP
MMKLLLKLFPAGHLVISVMFIVSAFALLAFAGFELVQAIMPFSGAAAPARIDNLLHCIALLTIAVAALELGQTIVEEEIQRTSHMSSPSRVRRFLSRFLVVLVVALSIEALVAVFRFSRDDPSQLPYAATIGLMAAALLAAWGVFIRLNLGAEELEPQALAAAKQEDSKVENAR